MRKSIIAGLTVLFAMTGTTMMADSWTLDGENSKVAFGSIKKDTIGEVHHFETITGSVDPAGAVSVEIDLTSVQTWIDIRNERMMEHVFQGAATATLTAQIDPAEFEALAVGETSTVDIEGALSLVGVEIPVEISMFVARLSDDKILATTDEMFFLGTEEAGIDAGVSKLMELAKLPGITRTAPVMVRFLFVADQKEAGVAPAAPAVQVAFDGDAKKGKKVFRKCRACHSVKDGDNKVGPHLAGVIGRAAGSVDGAKYSKAMRESGLIWDADTLVAYLQGPKSVVPGTSMSFNGLKKLSEVQDLLAYLAEQ
jgi:cytochrome c2/polyisoprenoid-binding protein YceI